MRTRKECLRRGQEGCAECRTIGGILYDCTATVISNIRGIAILWKAYRSMIVINGATRPEAQAAAVISEVILHGRFFVFHSEPLRERTEVGFG